MPITDLEIKLNLPAGSALPEQEYRNFLAESFMLMNEFPQYMCGGEGMETIELAHLIPSVSETILAIYIGINDAVCNKGLVTPFLPRHAHNNVFVFDPIVYSGGHDVPMGTIDASSVINGFLPPNASWSKDWTYVMISGPARTPDSLWLERGYIDMIPAKFEDFTMLTDSKHSRVCTYIDPEAFNHPVNQQRSYLKDARIRGERMADEFYIPEALTGENKGLVPVILERGEKLYVARPDFLPCDHCWTNIHPGNKQWAVVNENSAVPLDLITRKPPVPAEYRKILTPPAGSADSTTDWFFRAGSIYRNPVKPGHIQG
ncbi:hypothetical protein [Mangrovibacterium diazotrophicum]|uniref:Uncharacterized protein n=1 Tax=Mangrovibacterium diazotrophicum TaxID=1261403 RepID=A0A419VZ11_9BACT|nr:hypothetical protein [Mangrovibacterium diazotrophicum]RKD88300.1 hypothetical protein BC643_3445 [Mangrovibacterium diazotrophicum]